MNSNPTDDELLRGYLLGTLPEEEADRLERRLLAEDKLFELSEALEADLLAACDRGELAPEERERILERLASSPQGRERLALARALNTAARNRPETAPVTPFRRPTPRPVYHWMALAAGLLLAAGLSWYALERPHGGESAPILAHERPAPANPVLPEPAAPPSRPPQPPQVAQENRQAPERPKPAKVVCQLALMTLRGSETVKRLDVPPGAETVELQIGLEGMDDLKSFHLTVRNPKGEPLFDQGGLKPETLDGVPTLVVDLPADRLPAGRYEIETQGAPPGGEPEALSPLSVEVVSSSQG